MHCRGRWEPCNDKRLTTRAYLTPCGERRLLCNPMPPSIRPKTGSSSGRCYPRRLSTHRRLSRHPELGAGGSLGRFVEIATSDGVVLTSFRTNSRFGASAPRLHLVERRPSVSLVRAVGAVAAADAAVRCAAAEGARAWAGAADPGLRAQRGAAASGALGTGLRDSGGGRQNGVTAERAQLRGESAGRGVSASRAESARGRNTVLKGLRDIAGKPPALMRGGQNTQKRLGDGKIREIPGMAGIKRGFGIHLRRILDTRAIV